jgi:ubiquinone/menaquinone biosynthesis C-methylase UbiE
MFAHRDSAEREAVAIQRSYYAKTADRYDEMHVHGEGEHEFALDFLCSILPSFGIQSVLDIGCGTGRGLLKIKQRMPNTATLGIEPSDGLRAIGHAKGLSESELIDGDAMNLVFPDRSFDLVCEFGALHHIPQPSKAVAEMLRVARKAIFISDSNNFGQGGTLSRAAKQIINLLGLWPAANLVKTKGKGYTISEGDGLAYSYSVFNDYKQIAKACKSVHLLNTAALNGRANAYRSASHVAILGVKHEVTK